MIQQVSNTLTIVLEDSEVIVWYNILKKLEPELTQIGFNKKFSTDEVDLITQLSNIEIDE